MAALDGWTNGSVKKLLRHMAEGMPQRSLAAKMGVKEKELAAVISEIEWRDGFIPIAKSKRSEVVDFGNQHASHGYNAEFYRKAVSKKARKTTAILDKLSEELNHPDKMAAIIVRMDFEGMAGAIDLAAKIYQITTDEIRKRQKSHRYAYARQAAIIAINMKYPEYSHSRIGDFFNQDRTTIRHVLVKFGLFSNGMKRD